MYTLIDGVDFYDKDEVDTIVKSLTNGTLPDDIGKDLDNKITAEEAARTQADTDLGVRIDTESAERAQADADLGNRITAEEATRAQADTALNDKIVEEASIRSKSDLLLVEQIAAIEQLFTTLIGPNGFIDTDNDTVKVNDSGKSIRQIAHEEFYRQLITDADNIKQQLDTLKELADYLQNNPTVLTDMYAKLGITWSLDNPTDFGTFDFSKVLTADNVDDAVLELYNTFTNMIGDLTQLTTTFKDNIVGAVNEVDNNVKTKKYVDVYSINFKLDSLAQPIVLKDGINYFLLASTASYSDVYDVLSRDTKAAVAICDIDFDNKLYAHVDSITETCITFCGTSCITTVPDDGGPAYNTYRDITINWHNDGTAEMLLSRNYLNTRIDDEAAARTQATTDLGDRITAEETTRAQADSDLGDRITAEETARAQAVTDLGDRITDEETARAQADNALDQNIDELDAKIGDLTTLNTVEKGTVVDAINSEFEWRRKNDEAMEKRLTNTINAEVAARTQADTDLGARIDAEVGDLSTLTTTEKGSVVDAINEVKTLAEAGGGGTDGTLYITANVDHEKLAAQKYTEVITGLSHTYDEIMAEVAKDTPIVLKVNSDANATYYTLIANGKISGFDNDPLIFAITTGIESEINKLHYINIYISKDAAGTTTTLYMPGEVGGAGNTDTADSDVVVLSSNEDIISWFKGTNAKVTETSHIRIAPGSYNIEFTATGAYDMPMLATQGACKGAHVDGTGAKIHITLVIPGHDYQIKDSTAHPDIIFFDRPERNKAYWQGLHLSVLVKLEPYTGVTAAGNLTNPVWLFGIFNVSGHGLKIHYAAYNTDSMCIKPCGGVCKRNENGVYTASDICWWTDTEPYGNPHNAITTDMLGDCTLINCNLLGAFTRGDGAGILDNNELRMCAVINCSIYQATLAPQAIFGDVVPQSFDGVSFDDFLTTLYSTERRMSWYPYVYGHAPTGNDIHSLTAAISGANKYTN